MREIFELISTLLIKLFTYIIILLFKMILLRITNASEVVKAKAGKIFEKITPDTIDEKLVEAQVIQTMIEQLKIEGIKGEISSVKGLEVNGSAMITKSSFVVRETQNF